MPSHPSKFHLDHRLRQLSLGSSPASSLFYARLWHALCPETGADYDHEALHTLALCMLQAGEDYSALHLVRDRAEMSGDGHSFIAPGKRQPACLACALIVARCCNKLGRYTEGQVVLDHALGVNKGPIPALPILNPALSPASNHLLYASISHKAKSKPCAIVGYQSALVDDPWCWEAFTGLCDIGEPPAVEALFPDPPCSTSQPTSSRVSRLPTLSPNPMPRSSASEVPAFLPPRKQVPQASTSSNTGLGFFTPDVGAAQARLGMMGQSSWDTPSFAGDTTFPTIAEDSIASHPRRQLPNLISAFMPPAFRQNSTPVNDLAPATKPPAMKRPRAGAAHVHVAHGAHGHAHGHVHGQVARKGLETPQNGLPMKPNGRDLKSIEPNGEADAPVRRSTRLRSTSKPIPKVSRDRRTTRSGSATSSASGATAEHPSPPSPDIRLQTAADDWLRDVVRKCARAYRALSMYACKEAMREIDTLPSEIQGSPWALEIVARAYYEMANYVIARRAFKRLFELEPYRISSTEHYSTLLWHLNESAALSHLSQTLMSIDRESPQTWIAAGNCFSMHQEHDEAMRCFRRATQVDPACAYAWTLCGYEAIEMEEFERGIAFFRSAIRTDTRHYNAWYGMGLVYLKTGKPAYAEHHFRRAAEINPTNAVLLCCIGTVLEQSDDVVRALTYYEQACKYAPESPMVHFKRIRMLVALQKIDEAVSALEPLSRQAPDEANIFFLLGKCYLRLGRRAEATVALTTARELQPKLEGAIKVTIENNGEDEEDEDED